jgi:hypothetical protein
MCLSIVIKNPSQLLKKGTIDNFECVVTHNNMGYRCGYIRVLSNHPWFKKDYLELKDVEVHGNLTFAEADTACDLHDLNHGWWLGFDCCHAWDGCDPSLPFAQIKFSLSSQNPIRTTEYVWAELAELAQLAKTALTS